MMSPEDVKRVNTEYERELEIVAVYAIVSHIGKTEREYDG